MNIESVKERITALEAAGELSIKEQFYLASMKAHVALAAENAGLTSLIAENWNMHDVLHQLIVARPGGVYFNKWEQLIISVLNKTPATDAAIASLRKEAMSEALPRIQECDLKALLRFNETCEDGEGYDISKDSMSRLVEIGLCRVGHRGERHITPFGQWVIEAQTGEIDSKPLRTEGDVNADFHAHIDQIRSQSAPSPDARKFEQLNNGGSL